MAVQVTSAAQTAGPLEGRWGGDRMNLVFESGVGRLEMDCAGGSVAGPVKLATSGQFTAAGTFEQYQPGPQRADAPAAAIGAQYSGEVVGDLLKLSIRPAGATAAQVFNLRRGATIKLLRCL